MGKAVITEQYLKDIADAIRAKNGSSASYTPSQMAGAISAIEGGGTSGDVIISSDVPWSVSVTNPAHTVITSTPQAFLHTSNDTYTPRMKTVENIAVDTGYTPGRIIKTADETNHVISVTGEPAQEIAGMVQNGWGVVYQGADGSFYSDADYSQLISNPRGKILVAGMQNSDMSDLSSWFLGNDMTDLKNNFVTVACDYFLSGFLISSIEMNNLGVVGNYSFNSVNNIQEFVLPSLTVAGRSAFSNNMSLTTALFPSLSIVGNSFLNNNPALTTVRVGNLEAFPDDAFNGSPNIIFLMINADHVVPFPNAKNVLANECIVHVPENLVQAYATHADWATFTITSVS